MLLFYVVGEIFGLEVAVSFNFALGASHVKQRINPAGPRVRPLPVCQFMAEDISPPVLKQLVILVIRHLVNLLVRIKEPSSPTG